MDKLPIKIMFVDIDWTIFDHTIEEFDYESLKMLQKVQEKGILVYISTARPYHSVEQLGLFKYFKPDGMITSNGSLIFNNDEIFYGVEIPKNIVKNVCKFAKVHHQNVEVVGEKNRYVISRRMKQLETLYSTFFDILPEYQEYDGKPIYTMLFAGPSKYDDEVLRLLEPGMFHYRFSELGMDISYSPTEKGNAINIILEHHGISKENSLSIGDSNLDISMFESTKYSIAVGNAQDCAKEKATMVADTVMNHGVAKILPEILDL